MTSAQQRLTGRIRIDLAPEEAFRLFTPHGEQDWAYGWHPSFPAPAVDDTEPGTVFETHAHGQHTIWLVTSRQPGKRISYARVTPGDQAGTVTITVYPAGRHSEVEVTYQLTALTAAASRKLREFADEYPAYLQSWEDAITACLHHQPPRHRDTLTANPRIG
jgi:polyketide cyclase/dehydrase/lipid transport protein